MTSANTDSPANIKPPAGTDEVRNLVDRARKGDPRSVARLISLVENGAPQLREVTAALAPHTGQAYLVGLTGAPGVGKSTTTNALVGWFRAQGRRIGVLAVDPSSPFSGGALLGDRVRMQEHATDPEVFIRSMASRGHLGGLSAATPQALRVLDGAGCEVVLVETVGVGQSEIEIASAADTTVVLLAPGMGDGIQAAKAGILEIGDVYVVNKADRDGADATVRELHHMLALGARRGPGDWRPPIVKTVAADGTGLGDFAEALAKHRSWLTETGQLEVRRKARIATEIEAVALGSLRARFNAYRHQGGAQPGGAGAQSDEGGRLQELADEVYRGLLDPFAAADELLDSFSFKA